MPVALAGPAEGDAVPGAGRGARALVVDHGLHLGFPRGHAQGGGEVDRRRVQLLLRGHLEVPGRLLQGGHPQRLLRRHHGGGQGGGQEVRRPHGPEGSWHPLQVSACGGVKRSHP